jgi:RNA recognition motif-containing protein
LIAPSRDCIEEHKMEAEVPPNETLYVNNLNEKVKRDELRKALYGLFSQYGTVLDIVAQKSLKLRGQAFVIFRDIGSASTALKALQSFAFYDKPMHIQYAKSKSDLVAKIRGTFVPREKRPREEKPKPKPKKKETPAKKPKDEASQAALAPGQAAPGGGATGPAAPPQPKPNPPNKLLFVQNLPDQTTELMLSMLFQQFPGFMKVDMVPGKQGIAFVEFNSEMEAAVAMTGLQHFKITPTHLMVVSFAKK